MIIALNEVYIIVGTRENHNWLYLQIETSELQTNREQKQIIVEKLSLSTKN